MRSQWQIENFTIALEEKQKQEVKYQKLQKEIKELRQKAEKNDDYLFVYEKQAFGEDYMEDDNDRFLTNYYKDYDRTVVLEKGLIRDADNPTPNWDLYNTYKYTFKNIDGDYFFESLELVNE